MVILQEYPYIHGSHGALVSLVLNPLTVTVGISWCIKSIDTDRQGGIPGSDLQGTTGGDRGPTGGRGI